MEKPRLGFWQIWNMSFGFLGIQFGWNLQLGNMSAIYQYLGADPDQIPILWLAAPLTGLIVQPIIGHMSDRTWNRLGRRRPYFLMGAILSSIALMLMPHCSSLWMAAGLLWILDASINISMEPFRAFVADMLPNEQRTRGFAMQSFFIGIGAVAASALPWFLGSVLHVEESGTNKIPAAIQISYRVGAIAFLAAVLWTIFRTREYPPEGMPPSEKMSDILHDVAHMPTTMKQLAWVQLFTWLGLFCMWLYFTVAVARNIYGASDPHSAEYTKGVEWGNLCFGMYSAVCFLFSFVLPVLAHRWGRRATHSLCLLCGAAGLMSVGAIHTPALLLLSMTGVGIAWASTLSMPYAVLAGALPPGKTGVYMGIFNFFIVIPEICASLGFGWIMNHLFRNNTLFAVVCGGVFLLLAAILMQRVQDTAEATIVAEPVLA